MAGDVGSIGAFEGARGADPRSTDMEAENRTLHALAQALARDPVSVFRRIADAAIEITGSRSAGVALVDGERLRRVAVAGSLASESGEPSSGIPAPCAEAIRRNETLHLRDASLAFPGSFDDASAVGETLVVPIPSSGLADDPSQNAASRRPVGALWIADPPPGHGFGAGDARLLQGLAFFASSAERLVREPGRTTTLAEDSHERYRSLLDSIDDAFCIVEMIFDESDRPLDFVFIETNPSFERQTGVADVVGRSMRELHPDAESYWFDIYGHIALTGEATRFEARLDPREHWYDLYAFRIDDPALRRVAVLFNDIVERKRAESAVRISEEQFRQFGEASSNVLWIRDAETLNLRYVTSAYRPIYGFDPQDEPLGETFEDWLELILPEDRAKARDHVQRVLAGQSVSFVHRIRRAPDGAIRWLRNTDFPISNEAGEVASIGGISEDLTELLEAERRHETLVQGIPQLVWRTDEAGRWTWCNPQWSGYTGLSQAQSARFGWLDALHPLDRGAALAFWKEAGRTGQLEMEGRIRRHPDGAYRWFQMRATPVHDEDGSIVEWLGTSTDIDDLRRLQERQKVLVAELQHRTRNLLGVIRSLADKTLQTASSLADFRLRFRNRLGALARVQGLLSRLGESGRVTFDQLIEGELAAIYGATDRVTLTGSRGIELRSATVQTLAMALHELATNAVKHGALGQPQGRLSVAWHCEQSESEDQRWLRIVWDESDVVMAGADRTSIGNGQGRELIERALPYQFGARTLYEVKADGIRCTIALPVSRGS